MGRSRRVTLSVRRGALFLLLASFAVLACGMPVIDRQFGDLGRVRIGMPWGVDDDLISADVQADGKVLALGTRVPRGSGRESILLRFDSRGQIDHRFGQDGVSVLDAAGGIGDPIAVKLSPLSALGAGGILVGGKRGVARFAPEGSLDRRYGVNGYFVASEDVQQMFTQPEGAVLLLSGTKQQDGLNAFPLILTRLTPQGQLDGSFGVGGRKELRDLPPQYRAGHMLLASARPDGGLVLLAYSLSNRSVYALISIAPSGELDPAFGRSGVVTGEDLGAPPIKPQAFALSEDGGLWVYSYETDSPSAFLLRLTRSGALDASFAQGGRRDLGQCCGGNYNDGYMTMQAYRGGVAMVRQYSPNLDGGYENAATVYYFDAQGALSNSLLGARIPLRASGYLRLIFSGILVQADGSLVLPATAAKQSYCSTGHCYPRSFDIVLLGLSPSGGWQTGFGRGDGVAVWNTAAYTQDWVEDVLVEPSGKILAGGLSYTGLGKLFVARFEANGQPDLGFASNGRFDSRYYYQDVSDTKLARDKDGGSAIAATYNPFPSYPDPTTVFHRLGPDGRSFGSSDPRHMTPPENLASDMGLAFDSRGRLLHSQGELLEAWREDGSLDPLFGAAGKVMLPVPERPSDVARKSDLKVLADDSVVVATMTRTGPGLHKFDSSGRLDASFATGGSFIYPLSGSIGDQQDTHYTILLLTLPGGELLLGFGGTYTLPPPYSNGEGAYFRLLRITADGRLLSDTKIPGLPTGESGLMTWNLAALGDGSVLVARNQTLYRVLADGRVDGSFAEGGSFRFPLERVNSLAVDASGRLLVAGADATSAVLVRYRLDLIFSSAAIVEFYNSALGHYFISGGIGEIAAIESGAAGPGWGRTGRGFKAYAPETGLVPGVQPVCRFYGTPGRGPNSHFYTVDSAECEWVKRDPGWTYEGTAFYAFAAVNGGCAIGTQPVYRAYNMRFAQHDSNHRYTTDSAVYAQMLAQGWAGEGVKFCAAP